MKLYETFVFFMLFLAVSLSSHTMQAQSLDTENLIYCNSYHNVSKLWVLNDTLKIGTRLFSPKKSFVKDLILINKAGLVVDSLSIRKYVKGNTYTYSYVQDIFFGEEDKLFLFFHGYPLVELRVDYRSMKLTLIDEDFEKNRIAVHKEQRRLDPELKLLERTFSYKNLQVFYKQAAKLKNFKVKGGKSKFFGDHPEFYVKQFLNEDVKTIDINNEGSEVTNDLFYDLKDFEKFPVRVGVFWPYIIFTEKVMYFSIVRENACYSYDLESNEVTRFQFPAIEKGESQILYRDYINGNYYLVKKNKLKKYEVYSTDNDFSNIEFLKTFDDEPFKIVNGMVHIVKDYRSKKERSKCHYLIPLKEDGEDNPVEKLKEIIVND